MAMNTRRWRSVRSSSTARRTAATRSRRSACSSGLVAKRSGSRSQSAVLRAAAGRCQKCRPSLVDLQDHELAGPRREPAIPAERGEFGRDTEEGIVGRLVGQIVQFRTGDRVPSGAAAQLSTRDAQQQAVQPRQCLLAGRARAAERRQPLRRLIIGPAEALARTSSEPLRHASVISRAVDAVLTASGSLIPVATRSLGAAWPTATSCTTSSGPSPGRPAAPRYQSCATAGSARPTRGLTLGPRRPRQPAHRGTGGSPGHRPGGEHDGRPAGRETSHHE